MVGKSTITEERGDRHAKWDRSHSVDKDCETKQVTILVRVCWKDTIITLESKSSDYSCDNSWEQLGHEKAESVVELREREDSESLSHLGCLLVNNLLQHESLAYL